VTVIRPDGRRLSGVGPRDKWVDVRVTHGYLVAYEGDRPVFVTAISPGAEGINTSSKHSTRTGIFSVRVNAIAWDMGGRERNKPWFVEEVPWTALYKDDYRLHGAFWHDDFGRPKSHGCINPAPADGRFMFDWLDPALSQG
jgi:lipoprotein-anchoring transpeptidase ErfK/SrfK